MPKKGERQTPAQRRAAEAHRAKVKASAADRATQKRRIEMWRAGAYPMSEWSHEEIRRGRVGSDDGEFYGQGPRMTRREEQQLTAERRRRGHKGIEELMGLAVGTMKEVMLVGFPADRLRAAGMVTDRVLGKVPERVVELTEDPYADMGDEVWEDDRSDLEQKPKKRKSK